MTKSVIEMAREVGLIATEFGAVHGDMHHLERFAALVRENERKEILLQHLSQNEDEREACAKVCDDMFSHAFAEDEYDAALKCAAAIRARNLDELTRESQLRGEYE